MVAEEYSLKRNQWLESNLFETNEESLTQKEKICRTNKLINNGKAK